jgi:Ca-activated chloride channel family protein
MSLLASFHFLRPGWLLFLLPAAWVLWRLWRRQDPARQLRTLVRPELLEHLVLETSGARGRLRPIYLLAALWLLAVAAVAGPAWRKEEAPFGEETSALFVVLKVTPTMAAQDIQPSRGERAVHKLGDLLSLRAGGHTGLVAYAGSAHLVMPLTRDADIIRYFAAELDPDVMPRDGDDPVAAVRLAASRLQASGQAGSILLVADRVEESAVAGLAEVHDTFGLDIHVYGVAAGPGVVPPAGSPPAPYLDAEAMQRAARAGGGRFVAVRPDSGDLDALDANLTRSIAAAAAQQGERWRDEGYYLLWLVAVLSLLLWRRGGGVPLGASS